MLDWKQIVYGSLFLVLALVIAPFWPIYSVEPKFEPSEPSLTLPMSIPFRVHNNSSLFHMNRFVVACEAISVITTNGGRLDNNMLNGDGAGHLAPGSYDYYVCPFDKYFGFSPDVRIISARIRFHYSYYPTGRADNAPTTGSSPIFSLDERSSPYRWIEGTGLP